MMSELNSRIKLASMVLGVIIATGTVSAAGVKGVIYLADNRYMTQEAWIQRDKEREIKNLKRDIRELEIKQELNQITPVERALLKEYQREYKELTSD